MKLKILFFTILFNIYTLNATSLKEAVNNAIQKNPNLKYYQNNQEKEKMILKQLKADYYPTFNANAKLGIARTNSQTTSYNDENSKIKEYSLGLKQVVYNGSATTNNVKQQKNTIMKEYSNYTNSKNDLVLNVTTAYFNIIKNQKLLKVQEKNVLSIEKIYSDIKKSFDNGFAILSDLKKVESTLQNAKYQVLVQENLIDEWINSLEYYSNTVYSIYDLEYKNTKLIIPNTLVEAIKIANKNNPKIISASFNSKSLLHKYEATKTNKYPSLDLHIDKTRTGERSNSYGTTDQEKLYLNLNYSISFANKEKYQRLEQVKEYKKSKNNMELQKSNLKYNITKVWNKLNILNKQKKHLEYYYTYSQSTKNLYKQEFDIGNRKLIDLLIAQEELVEAKSNLINANFDYKIKTYELLYHMGDNVSVITNAQDTKNTYPHIKEIIYSKKYKNKLFLEKNKNKFIINLAVLEYRENLRKLVFENDLQNDAYAYKISTTNLMKLVYGVYDSRKEAKKVIKSLTNKKQIGNNIPYVTSVKMLLENIK